MARARRRRLFAAALTAGLTLMGIGAPNAASAPGRPAVREPGDSVEGALDGLAQARASVDALTASIGRLQMQVVAEHMEARAKVAERRSEQGRRIGRAIARYRNAGETVPALSTHARRLALHRFEVLFSDGDRHSRNRIAQLNAEAAFARASAANHEAELVADRASLLAALETREVLANKLANAGGAIVAVRPPPGISAAGTPVARRADIASSRLGATIGDAWNADAAWLEARHLLALELAARSGRNRDDTAAAIEAEWDATPRAAVLATVAALRQVGKAYVYATAGPSTFDCSGLTKRAYAEAGLGLPHFSASQLGLGAPVPADEIRAGDLLAYGPGGADHIAMYVGAGLAVEARSSASGVVLDPARRGGTFAGATRIVP